MAHDSYYKIMVDTQSSNMLPIIRVTDTSPTLYNIENQKQRRRDLSTFDNTYNILMKKIMYHDRLTVTLLWLFIYTLYLLKSILTFNTYCEHARWTRADA